MSETTTAPRALDNLAGLEEDTQAYTARSSGVPPEFRTQPPEPRQRATGIQGVMEDLPPSMRNIAQEQYRMLQQAGGGGTGVATARRDLALASGEREAREGYAQQYGERLRRYEGERIRTPDFLPTQENAMSLGTLFGLIATAGTLMGTKGNQSAMGALQAMNGMMTGWRQGRADLYNRERQNFEIEMRRVQAQNEELRRGFQDDLKLMQTNMDAGMARARERAAREGISIAAAGAARQGAQAYMSWLNGLQSTMAQIERNRQTASNAAPIVSVRQAPDGTTSYYYAHRDGSPIMGQDGQPLPAPPPRSAGGGAAGGGRYPPQMLSSMSVNSNEAAASIGNIVNLPEVSTTGIFQGRNTSGLLNAPLGVAANILSSETTQRYNNEVSNFAKFLAYVQSTSYYYAHRDGSPIMGQDGQPLPAPPPRSAGGGAAGGGRYPPQMLSSMSVNSNEAAASIGNIVNLPEVSTTGIFQGRNTSGLLNAPLGVAANILSSETTQRYNNEVSNFAKFLAYVQSGGRQITNAAVEAGERAFKIMEGDSPATVLTKMASMRQQLERAIEVQRALPNLPQDLKDIFTRNLSEIEQAIPFTVNDVNRWVNGRDRNRTFADFFRSSGVMEERPQIGTVREGYRFMGGDPSKPENWEQVR